jgi:hypothetical protein
MCVWATSPASAVAAPTLTITGRCGPNEFGQILYFFDVFGSGFEPNDELAFFEESTAGDGVGPIEISETGTFTHQVAFGFGPEFFPESFTFSETVWDDLDNDLNLEAGEPVLATDTLTVVCPLASPERRIEQARASGTINRGEARSLLAKLESAAASAASENSTAARNKLKAFIREVKAMLRSGRIPSPLGQDLIAAANARIAILP